VPPWHLGIASGILAAMRNVGMVLGIAVTGAVLYNIAPVTSSMHPGYFDPEGIREFLDGMGWAYITGAGIAGLAACTSLFARAGDGQPLPPGPPPGAAGQGPG
jgi:hypothetical protein